VQVGNNALKDEEIAIRAEVAAAQSDYESRRQALVKLMPGMLARAAETSEVAEGAYRLGGADILRLLDATRIDIETHVLYVQTLVDYQQSAVNLQLATGMLR
jgi:outer membrane protein, heavy metal efflux system